MEEKKKPTVLRFNPTQMSREYGSNIYITKGEKIDRVQFRTSIIYAGNFQDIYPIFHLYKHDIYINKTEPDEHSYRLATACCKTFYPIVVICDKEGQILGIRNDLIRKRWKEQKPNIEREFTGEYAKRYIEETDRRLSDSNWILNLVYKELFFNTFFAIKFSYIFELDRELNKEMPFFAFSPSLKTQGIQKNKWSEEAIFINQTGKIIDDRKFSYSNLLHQFDNIGYGTIKGDYTIDYELDQELRLIDSIILNTKLSKENGEELIHIKMESYYLREYPLENIEDLDTIELGRKIQKEKAKEEKRNRKSFWQRFKDHLNEPL